MALLAKQKVITHFQQSGAFCRIPGLKHPVPHDSRPLLLSTNCFLDYRASVSNTCLKVKCLTAATEPYSENRRKFGRSPYDSVSGKYLVYTPPKCRLYAHLGFPSRYVYHRMTKHLHSRIRILTRGRSTEAINFLIWNRVVTSMAASRFTKTTNLYSKRLAIP